MTGSFTKEKEIKMNGKEQYDWKRHYDCTIKPEKSIGDFKYYTLENDTGSGKIVTYEIFPGLLAVYNDLSFERCGKVVEPGDDIIQINYCSEGRYVRKVSDRYMFYVSHGDLSIGTVGRRETGGLFPTKRFCGLSLFMDFCEFQNSAGKLLDELKISLNEIIRLSKSKPRYYTLREIQKIDQVYDLLISAIIERRMPMIRLKVFELLMILCDPEIMTAPNIPEYLSKKQVDIAKEAEKMMTEDLSTQLTISEMAGRIGVSPTSLKTAFKGVYGVSIKDYRKQFKYQEAMRLVKETSEPITEIAAMVGYSNPGKFIAGFKSSFGVTPGALRKKDVRFS